jgi:uncharacterized protein
LISSGDKIMPYLKKTAIAAVIFLIMAACSVTAAMALEVPELTGRVNDYAGMLKPETVTSLEASLLELEKTDSTQIVVLTINSLEGEVLEQFSIKVAEKWKIAHKGRDNGAILLISKQDRKVRIEVGYGLEGRLTDLMSGRIISDIIVPAFKSGDYDTGVLQGVDAMIKTVRGEYTSENFRPQKAEKKSSGGIFAFLFIAFISSPADIGQKPHPGRSGRSGHTPWHGLLFLPLGIMLLFLIPAGFLLGLIVPLWPREPDATAADSAASAAGDSPPEAAEAASAAEAEVSEAADHREAGDSFMMENSTDIVKTQRSFLK